MPTHGITTELGSIVANDRIRLRPTSIADLDFVIRAEQHPENAAFIRQWSRRQHHSAIADDDMAHWIVERRSEGNPLGYIILCGLEDADCSVELKRIVIVEKQQGFGRDACSLVKKVAFEQLKVHRLWLEVMESNKRARRLYTAEGFFSEGIHREAVKVQNRFQSVVVMSLLEYEYQRPIGTGAQIACSEGRP